MQRLAQRAHELFIASRFRADNVDRPAQAVVLERKQNDAHNVVQRDPAPVLLPAANATPQPQAEGQQHRRQRPSIAGQHHAEAQVHHTYSRFARGIRSQLPLLADLRQEPLAGRTLLGQQLVAAITVVADGRRGDEHARLSAAAKRVRSRRRQHLRPAHPAVADFLLELRCPVSRDVLACKMYNRIAAGKLDGIQRLRRIPLHLALARRPADQGNGLVTVLAQGASHVRSNQSRSTADQYAHRSRCKD